MVLTLRVEAWAAAVPNGENLDQWMAAAPLWDAAKLGLVGALADAKLPAEERARWEDLAVLCALQRVGD